MTLFIAPAIISVAALSAVWWWGGFGAFFIAVTLVILEVTLSFDNAVVNAKVLEEMTPQWQRRFLTWGILLSVFGTRLVLPILIVSAVALVSPFVITALAFSDPATYSGMLAEAETTIKAFGGAFLLMVSLKYFFNVGKKVHWFAPIERHLVRWGRVEAIEIALALSTLLAISYLSPDPAATILTAGLIGIIIFTLTEGVAHALNVESTSIVRPGLILFIYLNVLDSAFSLDGVIGAFAITTALPIIVVGLGIGAYFVRSMTVYLVRKKTLAGLPYLEHGAHWAVFGLALAMLVGLIVHIPEVAIATIGLAFISLAYVSSRRAVREQMF
ncbi:MAG TPA: DUF475 domain-containing protein [Candidatus Paceibacterota bacterium]